MQRNLRGIRTIKTMTMTQNVQNLMLEAENIDRFHLAMVYFGYELEVSYEGDSDSANETDADE